MPLSQAQTKVRKISGVILSHGVLKAVFRRGESILETVFGTFFVSLAQTRKIGPQNRFSRFIVFCVFPFETPLSRLR